MKGKHKTAKVKLEVEDHGNGYMVIGTASYRRAARYLAKHFVDNPEDYMFACPTWYEGKPAVWLTTKPGAVWIGAKEPSGKPIER